MEKEESTCSPSRPVKVRQISQGALFGAGVLAGRQAHSQTWCCPCWFVFGCFAGVVFEVGAFGQQRSQAQRCHARSAGCSI